MQEIKLALRKPWNDFAGFIQAGGALRFFEVGGCSCHRLARAAGLQGFEREEQVRVPPGGPKKGQGAREWKLGDEMESGTRGMAVRNGEAGLHFEGWVLLKSGPTHSSFWLSSAPVQQSPQPFGARFVALGRDWLTACDHPRTF